MRLTKMNPGSGESPEYRDIMESDGGEGKGRRSGFVQPPLHHG